MRTWLRIIYSYAYGKHSNKHNYNLYKPRGILRQRHFIYLIEQNTQARQYTVVI